MRVKLVAPARWVERELVERFAALAARHGIEVEVSPQCFERSGQLAGSDETRAAALVDALSQPGVDAVWCARGGYGAGRLLERLGGAPTAAAGRILIGYSDVTMLLLGIRNTGLRMIHGPMPIDLSAGGRDANFLPLFAALAAGRLPGAPELPAGALRTVVPGRARGPVVAANLSLLTRLVGTPHGPDLRGAILILEDVDEKLYAVDRMLVHLRHAGVLHGLAGLVMGGFTGLSDDAIPFGEDVPAMTRRLAGDLGIPVIEGYPVGHGPENAAVPQGVPADLIATPAGARLVWQAGAR